MKYLIYSLPIVLFFIIGPANEVLVGQGMTPWQLAQTESVASIQIDENNEYIAFIKVTPANPMESNSHPSTSLHVLHLESGDIHDIETPGNIGGLTLRPEHNSFTVSCRFEDDPTNSIAEVCLTSKKVKKLFSFNTNILGYQWNPDGNHVGFMARYPEEEEKEILPYSVEIYEEGLVNRKAWIANVTSTWPNIQKIEAPGSTYIMEWSPDGKKIAVSSAPTPHVDDQYMFQRVRIADAKTGGILNEINNEGKIGQIQWSPDGERLAFIGGNDIHDLIDGRIMMVNASGGNPQNIFEDFEGKFESFEWVNENTMYVLTSESTARYFGTIQPDGSNYNRLIKGEDLAMTSFSRSSSGAVAFIASTANHPSEIYYSSSGNNQVERLTHFNPWLEGMPFGEQRVVKYTSRDEKFDIEGLLILPLDYKKGQQYPLIVMVHGGPEAHYSNGWLTAYSMPGQVGAARGFAVFYPNYRGSTGRGIEFTMSSQRDLSGAEFDDIVDGVDYLIDEGIADPDRIGVTGGSYGGYATAWMSTYYSERFAAGVMFVGISNNLSKWGTSDIPEELYLVHSRERLWKDWMNYLKRSPVYYVDRSETPLLIMHGKEDTRVHPGQSLELYRHIKVRKPEVPLRLVWYPGEGHGNRKATSRFDYNLRMLRWFETYLKEEDADLPDRALMLDNAGIPEEFMPE